MVSRLNWNELCVVAWWRHRDTPSWTSWQVGGTLRVRSLLAGEWLWIDSNGENGTQTSRTWLSWLWILIDLWSLRSYGGLKSQDVENVCEIFAFFKTTPHDKTFKILFRQNSPPHRSRRVVFKFREIWPMGKAVRTWNTRLGQRWSCSQISRWIPLTCRS